MLNYFCLLEFMLKLTSDFWAPTSQGQTRMDEGSGPLPIAPFAGCMHECTLINKGPAGGFRMLKKSFAINEKERTPE
jgi:hypothetical protein